MIMKLFTSNIISKDNNSIYLVDTKEGHKLAYDLIKLKWYDFDFHMIVDLCKQNENLVPFYDQLNAWENSILKIQQSLLSDIKKNEMAIKTYAFNNEIFQFPFTFNDGQKYIYQFNATSINYTLDKTNNKNVEDLPLFSFSTLNENTPEARYQYTHYERVTPPDFFEKPIAIVKFKDLHTNGIVVDGNHRLSSYRKYKEQTIKGIFLFPTGVIHFGTPLDQAMYLFYNDVQMFSHFHGEGYSPNVIIGNSLLNHLR